MIIGSNKQRYSYAGLCCNGLLSAVYVHLSQQGAAEPQRCSFSVAEEETFLEPVNALHFMATFR